MAAEHDPAEEMFNAVIEDSATDRVLAVCTLHIRLGGQPPLVNRPGEAPSWSRDDHGHPARSPSTRYREDKHLRDLGADSVDRVEIIMLLLERLRPDEPMSSFSAIPDIDALIDFLLERKRR